MSSRRPGTSSGGGSGPKLRMDRQPALARISGKLKIIYFILICIRLRITSTMHFPEGGSKKLYLGLP